MLSISGSKAQPFQRRLYFCITRFFPNKCLLCDGEVVVLDRLHSFHKNNPKLHVSELGTGQCTKKHLEHFDATYCPVHTSKTWSDHIPRRHWKLGLRDKFAVRQVGRTNYVWKPNARHKQNRPNYNYEWEPCAINFSKHTDRFELLSNRVRHSGCSA